MKPVAAVFDAVVLNISGQSDTQVIGVGFGNPDFDFKADRSTTVISGAFLLTTCFLIDLHVANDAVDRRTDRQVVDPAFEFIDHQLLPVDGQLPCGCFKFQAFAFKLGILHRVVVFHPGPGQFVAGPFEVDFRNRVGFDGLFGATHFPVGCG